MIHKQAWFERTFPNNLPPATLPLVIERLRGTPTRLICVAPAWLSAGA